MTHTEKNLPNRPRGGGLLPPHVCRICRSHKKPSQETQQPACQKYLVGANRNIASLSPSHQSGTVGHHAVQEHTTSAAEAQEENITMATPTFILKHWCFTSTFNIQPASEKACMHSVCRMGESANCTQDAANESTRNVKRMAKLTVTLLLITTV